MRNLLLITVDSLREDVCDFINKQGHAPYLSSLSKDSIVFQNTISPGPRTPSSVPVFMTGEYNRHDGYQMAAQRQAINHHIEGHETIPEQLSKQGYTTVGFSANPWTSTDTGFREIFDEFVELTPNSENNYNTLPDMTSIRSLDRVLKKACKEDLFQWNSRREWFSHWTGYYEQIKNSVSSIDEPYFVWIFLMDTHHPYITPPEFRKESNTLKLYYSLYRYIQNRGESLPNYVVEWLKDSYHDAVGSADEFVCRIHNELSDSDPILIFHADHGEAHGEHGTYGHEQQLYEENIRVPMLVYGTNKDTNVTDPFSLASLPQMIEHISSGSAESITDLIEPFVVSDVESTRIADRRADKLNYNPHYVSIRGKKLKYIQSKNGSELYNMFSDPNEESNLADSYPDIINNFEKLANTKTSKQREKRKIKDMIDQIGF